MRKFIRGALLGLAVIMLVLGIYNLIQPTLTEHKQQQEIPHLLAKIHEKWPHLTILTNIKTPDFLEDKMKLPVAHAKIAPISTGQLVRVLKILPGELDKYPKSMINDYLEAIGLSSAMSMYGIHYGGTNAGQRIYLTVRNYYTDEYLKRLIHHEFSSVLMRYTTFPYAKWQSDLPKTVKYIDNEEEVKKVINTGGRHMRFPDAALLKEGFVASYGKTNLENDVNTYAELLFTEPVKLKELAKKYQKIGVKYKLLIQFYEFLAPRYKWIFLR